MPDINILINTINKNPNVLKDVGGEIDNVSSKANSAANGGLTAFSNAIGNTIKAAALAGGAALAGIGAAVIVTGTNFNNMKEQANIAFTTMLGSGQQAKVFLDDLQKFAASTPFEFPDLLQASQRLLAMGFAAKDVKPTLTAVGDAVAGLGGGSAVIDRVTTALGQMQAKGKASGEEMMQLTEAGIPAWKFLADAIGTNVADAMDKVSKGTISADVAIAALVDGMNTKFGGLMEKQSKTFGGLFSTIKDTFTQVSGQVTAPLFAQMTAGLSSIVDWTNKPEFAGGVKALSDWIGKTTEQIIKWTSGIWPDVLGVLKSVYNAVQLLITGDFRGGTIFGLDEDAPFLLALFRARDVTKWLYDNIVKLIAKSREWLDRALEPIDKALRVFFDAMDGVIDITKAILKPIGDAILKFVKIDDVITALGVLMAGPALTAIWGLISGLAAFLAPIAAVVAAVAALRWAWQNDFGGLQTFTLGVVKKISDWFFTESGIWKGTWEDTVMYVVDVVDRFWRIDLYNLIVGTWAQIKFETTQMTIKVRDTLEAWSIKAIDLFNHWVDVVGYTFRHTRDLILQYWHEWTDPTFKAVTDWVARTVSHINTWVQHWKDKMTPWSEWVISKFQGLIDWWDTNIQPWINAGRDIIQGLWDGIKEKWNNLSDWFSGVWGDLTDKFKRFFGIASPSSLFASYGRFLMEGLAGGIAEHQHLVTQQVESMTNSVTAQMERLKGAMVQNVFDINQAAQQLKLNPALLPTALGGTGKVIGLGPNGELILEGITNLPKTGTPTAPTSPPLVPAANTLLNAVGGGNTTTALAQKLLGGISLNAADLDFKGVKNNAIIGQAANALFDKLSEILGNQGILSKLQVEDPGARNTLQSMLTSIGKSITSTSGALSATKDIAGFKSAISGFSESVNKAFDVSRKNSALLSDELIQRTLMDLQFAVRSTINTGLNEGINQLSKASKDPVKEFIAGIGDFLRDTANNTKIWHSLDSNLTGITELRAADKSILDKLADLLGIDTLYGGLSENNIKAAMEKITSGTDINKVKALLQSTVDFRSLANFYSTSDFANVLPTDPRLTGQPTGSATTNQYNITLQGSGNPSTDIMGLIQLFSSLGATASP